MEAFLICRHPTRPSMGNVPYDTPYILSHSPLINHSVIELILSHSIGAVKPVTELHGIPHKILHKTSTIQIHSRQNNNFSKKKILNTALYT